MFVQINNQRIKISSIGRYKDLGESQSTHKYCVMIKIGNTWEAFYFKTEHEKDTVLKNLDEALKVTVL